MLKSEGVGLSKEHFGCRLGNSHDDAFSRLLHAQFVRAEAVKLANETPYGLGASVWGNPEEAEKLVPFIEAGMVFVNEIVASDPRLPFGGVKKSGLGSELSRYGMLEFTAKRTIWVA